ncbi:MAG: glycoside hydrolase family 3 N-terminal domain-containing protein [Limisphaerales bacterium]
MIDSAPVQKWIIVPCLLLLVCAVVGFAGARPLSGTTSDREIENKISNLLASMTLAEKLGQLQQLDGTWDGDIRPGQVELARQGLLGSAIYVRGAKRTAELQRVAMTGSKLKIPILFSFDVIHGYRTIFPVPLGEAASWDPSMVERADSIAAAEASAAGIRWTFAPMVDIARDPRWGRIVEGSGEDPFLGAAMAAAAVRGFQGTNYSHPDKIVACAKHWVAYGAAEGGRDYNTTEVSERTLREIYFPPFKAAMDAGVGTVMSALNDLDGIPCTANSFILTDVLRGEWHFHGIVISDWNAVKELIAHGVATNGEEAAARAMTAGVDMEMVSRLYNEHGEQLQQDGKISMATIDRSVRRVLRVKYRLGLFEHPYADEGLEATTLLSPANLTAARELATRTFVLLKNDHDTLPISRQLKAIAVIGPLADDAKSMMGPWSGDGRKEDAVTLLAGIRAELPTAQINYAKGCDVTGDSHTGFEQAINTAKESDFTILAVGESADMSGEAASRSSLDLPGQQLELIQAIHAIGKPYAVVLMNGRPLSINWVATNSPAILETWFAGTQGGNAIADTLFGDVNPGGKLPVTFPRSVGQIPVYYDHKNTGRPPGGDSKDASQYSDIPWTPLYPFGYGLSYTQFRLSHLQMSATRIRRDGTITIGVDVENMGDRAGDEVVQLYLHDLVASVTRPVKALKGFERVSLRPGESRHVEFTLGPRELGFYNQAMQFVVEPGTFKVMVGTSSEEGMESSFEVRP